MIDVKAGSVMNLHTSIIYVYSFLLSSEARNISWFHNTCKHLVKTPILEDKCIKNKCQQHIEKLHQKLKSLE